MINNFISSAGKINQNSFKFVSQMQSGTQRPASKVKNDTLHIFYFNDPHGNSDQMSGVVNSARNFKLNSSNLDGDSFILSAGDNYSGGDLKKNDYILSVLQNLMGVDASTVGNHEIDGSIDGFLKIAKDKKIQFVATNVEFDDEAKVRDVIKKSFIKEQNGTKYGFVGTMPLDFTSCTKEDVQKGLTVSDFDKSVEALQKEINNLEKQGVNRIIMLSHSGYDVDKKYAQNLEGVDVIIGGHTHSVVEGAQKDENIVMSKTGKPVLITQAGENGKFYGIAKVEFDDAGIIKKIGNKLFNSPSMLKSPVLEKIKEQFLGVSPTIATIKESEPLPKNRRIEPCGWTELMADAMRSEMGVDIALINSANTRKVPQIGPLTQNDVVESSPMKNKLIKTKISQKQLVEAIKQAAINTVNDEDGVPGYLQASGITYKIDDKANLLEMNFVDKNGNKTPIDINNPFEDTIYSVTYDNFVAKKDGETPELFPQFPVEEFDYDKDKTLIDYISKLENKNDLRIKTDGRLEIQKT